MQLVAQRVHGAVLGSIAAVAAAAAANQRTRRSLCRGWPSRMDVDINVGAVLSAPRPRSEASDLAAARSFTAARPTTKRDTAVNY